MNRLVLMASMLGLWLPPVTATGLKACDKKQEGVSKTAPARAADSAEPHAGKPAEHPKCKREDSPQNKGKPESNRDSTEKAACKHAGQASGERPGKCVGKSEPKPAGKCPGKAADGSAVEPSCKKPVDKLADKPLDTPSRIEAAQPDAAPAEPPIPAPNATTAEPPVAVPVAKPAVAPEDPPGDKPAPTPAPPRPKPAVRVVPDTTEDLAESDPDFPFQGEYVGCTCTMRLGAEYAGLQVAALGDGQFRAVQYRRGLPGAGWNGVDQFVLEGQREGDTVRLEAHGRSGTYTVLIRRGVAEIRNSAWRLLGRFERIERVSHTMGAVPPARAIVLFDGSLFDGSGVQEFASGEIVDGDLLLAGPVTRRDFRDFHLHVEFRTPYMPLARGQGRGNSGVYVQKRYEIQILDSFSLSGEANECGGLYRQRPPAVNMALPPLAWQTYDIDFTAARFNQQGEKIRNARITVAHNGVVIHDDVELTGKTGAGDRETAAPGPIRFQWHGNPVVFRNMWIVDNDAAETPSHPPATS